MRIYSVDRVTVYKVAESPLTLSIRAQGMAASSGWTNPRLQSSGNPDAAGASLEYDFEADRPGGLTLPVLTPIHAAIEVKPAPDADRVLVYAHTNSIAVPASEFIAKPPPGASEPTTTAS